MLDWSKLLDNIGLADINFELEKQTEALLEEHGETIERNIDTSISDTDLKNYIKAVLRPNVTLDYSFKRAIDVCCL